MASNEMMSLVNGESALQQIGNEIGLDLRAEPLRNLWVDGRDNSLESILAAALMVFSVTLANCYNLFLLRLARRRQEFALQEAVGAQSSRCRWQMTLEAIFHAGLGTSLAIVLMPLGIALLRRNNVLPDDLPQAIGNDSQTVLVVLIMFAITAMVLASASLAHNTTRVYEVLRQSGNGQTGSSRIQRVRQALVVGQIATSFILLFGTALLVRSSWKLLHENVGFDRSGRLIGILQPTNPNEDSDVVRQRISGWIPHALGIPGIQAIGLSTSAPFSANVTLEQFRGPQSNSDSEAEDPKAYLCYIDSDYPTALGLHIVRGRSFTQEEAREHAQVALIDVDMSVMDGMSYLRALRRMPGGNKVLVVSTV
jgi:CheY-like chemotaxis protein